ncbi:ornithine cyclodeaminase family protein [Paenalcaligenes niemegkensis]|uniref:ornithine cyclodeaminase family protein n=1 Tax=Paenalcaligenes niemegkensis TaxID=2895469 RepID=UPI001EE87169|nr:ornithine cyclodeaminase family protein [Paenalcaligenes niemegkensis]MCQ9617690.1 ornithine cyclodeaminase family protein [Paenalcaligenes niemegkensis]
MYIDNAEVRQLLVPQQLEQVLETAYLSWQQGHVAMQPRFRTEVDGFRLVSMGAVIPELGYAGSKLYSSYMGKLCFRVVLFSTKTGGAVATLESNEMTPIRTAASSLIAARRYANPQAHTLGVFGLGPLGLEHIRQFVAAFPIQRVYVCDPYLSTNEVKQKLFDLQVEIEHVSAETAVLKSQIVVTATRSLEPVFDGDHLQAGSFVAAIGSCLSHAQEIDEKVIERAAKVIVEWPEQTLKDTGDLVLFPDQKSLLSKLEALADTIQKPAISFNSSDIIVYKAVGIALTDIAAAALVLQQKRSMSEANT